MPIALTAKLRRALVDRHRRAALHNFLALAESLGPGGATQVVEQLGVLSALPRAGRATLVEILPKLERMLVDPDWRVTLEGFLDLIASQGPGRLAQVIGDLGDEPRRVLHYCLIDWLNAQPATLHELLERLHADETLRAWLYDALNTARSEAERTAETGGPTLTHALGALSFNERTTLVQILPKLKGPLVDPGWRVTLEAFLALMESEGRGHLAQVIDHLSDQAQRALYYCLIDWLNAQPATLHGLLEQLRTNEALRAWLYDALNDARAEAEFADVTKRSKVRELYLAELFDGIEDVSVPVGAINEETGLPNKVDMLYVCAICRHLGARRVFEFGTYLGRTTFHIARAVPAALVYTLDLPKEEAGRYAPYLGAYLERRGTPGNVRRVVADSRDFDTTELRGTIDVAFVDGDHSLEMVANDTAKALELLRPGGTIIWHDFAPKTPGVSQFIERFSSTRPVFHIRNTALAVYRDGIDAMSFRASPLLESLEAELQGRQ